MARLARKAAWRAGGHAGLIALLLAAPLAYGPAPAAAAPLTVTAKPPPADVEEDSEDFPVPPIPPDLPPGAQAAPLPDFSSAAPLPGRQTAQPGFRPEVFHSHSYNRGDGYVNGSGGYDEGRFKQGPSAGIRLDVPLQ